MRRFICIVLLAGLFLSGCEKKTYSAPTSQSRENVVQVELVDSQDDSNLVVLYTLDTTEQDAFLDTLMSLAFSPSGPPPSTSFGPIAVRLTYQDGYCDVIGINSNCYFDTNGEAVGGHYWYYVVNVEDYYSLFSQYVSEDLLPRPDRARYKKK